MSNGRQAGGGWLTIRLAALRGRDAGREPQGRQVEMIIRKHAAGPGVSGPQP